MTIRFLNSKDGYAKGSVVRSLSVTAEAAYVANNDAEYESPSPGDSGLPLRRVLAQQGIPCIIVPNGTVATSGAITVGTALPLIYPRAWVYLPAAAVVGGLAGWYYTVFSSTTLGQVYTNYQAAMDKPFVPATLVAAVGSNSAYTTVISTDVVMGAAIIPANLLGAFGSVDVTAFLSYNSTAGAKVGKVRFGAGTVVSSSATTTTGLTIRKRVQNRATNSQVIQASLETGVTVSVAPTLLAIDTTADVQVDVVGQVAVATDYIILESLSVEVLPTP